MLIALSPHHVQDARSVNVADSDERYLTLRWTKIPTHWRRFLGCGLDGLGDFSRIARREELAILLNLRRGLISCGIKIAQPPHDLVFCDVAPEVADRGELRDLFHENLSTGDTPRCELLDVGPNFLISLGHVAVSEYGACRFECTGSGIGLPEVFFEIVRSHAGRLDLEPEVAPPLVDDLHQHRQLDLVLTKLIQAVLCELDPLSQETKGILVLISIPSIVLDVAALESLDGLVKAGRLSFAPLAAVEIGFKLSDLRPFLVELIFDSDAGVVELVPLFL